MKKLESKNSTSSQKNKSSGSVVILVLILCAFCTTIATLFLRNALDEVKYRKQIQISTKAKIEAYSFLDLVLSFLSDYKKTDSVPSISDSNTRGVRKDTNKLIFDEEIVGAPPAQSFYEQPNASTLSMSDLISTYIAKNISKKLTSSDSNWPDGFANVTLDTTANNGRLKHGDLTIECIFEDLSAKIPLCKGFNNSAPGLIKAALTTCGIPETSIGKISEFLGIAENSSGSNPKYIPTWTAFEKIGNITDRNVLQKAKAMFVLEPFIAGEQENTATAKSQIPPNTKSDTKNPSTPPKITDSNLKINLLTACNELRNQINSWAQGGNITSKAGITLSSSRKKEEVEKFINDHSINVNGGIKKQFSSFCSTETIFFSLKIHVNDGTGNSFSLICLCGTNLPAAANTATNTAANKAVANDQPSATSAKQPNTKRRLPFNIIRIEEI